MRKISDNDIERHFHDLIKLGVKPTIKRIIERHGAGSSSTVAPVLKRLKLNSVITQSSVDKAQAENIRQKSLTQQQLELVESQKKMSELLILIDQMQTSIELLQRQNAALEKALQLSEQNYQSLDQQFKIRGEKLEQLESDKLKLLTTIYSPSAGQ